MIKHLKLIFYILSALVLGGMTIWEIMVVRNSLAATDGKAPEQSLGQIRSVVEQWEKRKPISAAQPTTIDLNSIKTDATRSGRLTE